MHLGVIASLAVFISFVKYVRYIIIRHNKDLVRESGVTCAILDYDIAACQKNIWSKKKGLNFGSGRAYTY